MNVNCNFNILNFQLKSSWLLLIASWPMKSASTKILLQPKTSSFKTGKINVLDVLRGVSLKNEITIFYSNVHKIFACYTLKADFGSHI